MVFANPEYLSSLFQLSSTPRWVPSIVRTGQGRLRIWHFQNPETIIFWNACFLRTIVTLTWCSRPLVKKTWGTGLALANVSNTTTKIDISNVHVAKEEPTACFCFVTVRYLRIVSLFPHIAYLKCAFSLFCRPQITRYILPETVIMLSVFSNRGGVLQSHACGNC